MEGKKNRTRFLVVFLMVLAAFVIRMVNRKLPVEKNLFPDFIRTFLHMGLVMAWSVSLFRRVLQTQARRYLCAIAVLMFLWLNFKAFKYFIIQDVHIGRYLWYLYYLSLVYIPLFILFTSLCIGRTEEYRLPRWIRLLHLPAAVLFGLVITNDLHQFVFRFPADALLFTDYDYEHRLGYILVFAWFTICTFIAFANMLTRNRAKRRKKEFIPLIVSLVMSVTYIVTYLFNLPFTMYIAGDLSAACCLLFCAVLESCVYCGLLPTNIRYEEMFAASGETNAQIVDEQYRVRYSSSRAEPIPAEKMKQAKDGPIPLSGKKILHTMPIAGGYTVWTEDVSEMTKLQKELMETKEELTERSAMLKYEYELEKERKTVEEQNRLYDLLTDSVQNQINQISRLMKAYELTDGDTEKGDEILSRIAVLGSYVKRKKHLTLSIYSGIDIPELELKNALAESIRYLQFMNVRGTLFVDTEREFLPGNMAVVAYDFFEAAVEAALDSLFAVGVTVSVVSEVLRIRLVLGCKEELSGLLQEWPEASAEVSDEDEWTLVLPLGGGAVR